MKVDFAIITILPEEYKAIYDRFKPTPYTDPASQHIYGMSEVQTNEGRSYKVAIARTSRPGNDTSQQLASRIITDLDPQILLVVGVAGGVPDDGLTLGDVVVSSHIHNFNLNAKQGEQTTFDASGGIHPRISNITASLGLFQEQLANWNSDTSIGVPRPPLLLIEENIQDSLDRDVGQAWRDRVKNALIYHFGNKQRGNRSPKFLTSTIASSNSLIQSDAVLAQWLQNARSILAVEMETAGVYQAAQQMQQQYPVMAIRGISNIVGFKHDDDWKQYACHTAAAFAYAFITAGIVKPRANMPAKVTRRLGATNNGGGASPHRGQTGPGSDGQRSFVKPPKNVNGTRKKATRRRVVAVIGVLLLLASIIAGVIYVQRPHSLTSLKEDTRFAIQACLDAQKQGIKDGIGVHLENSDCTGISGGNAVFYFNPNNETAVQDLAKAAQSSRQDGPFTGKTQGKWLQAIADDPTDAEPRIYYEDIQVQTDSHPHTTIIVPAVLTGKYGYDGPDALQGVYLQQKEHNDACRKNNYHNCILLNVLVANIGSGKQDESDYATQVTDQMVDAIKHDPTIVGVMSGVTSQSTIDISTELQKRLSQEIPVVASKATVDPDKLPQTDYLFRVVPPNSVEAQAATDFAKNVLHVKSVAVLYRSDNTYGINLAGDFDGDFHLPEKTYQLVGQPTKFDPNNRSSIENALTTVLQYNPDLLYCACYVLDVNTILEWFAHHSGYDNLHILGGDSLYGLGGYTPDARSQWDRLYFTAFTYPDLWGALPHPSVLVPQGIGDYKDTYGAKAGDGQYGSTRMTPSASVGYDAMFVLAKSCDDVFAQNGAVTALSLRNTIAHQNIIGISGRISFGRSGGNASDPDNKIIVVVQIVKMHFQYANFEEGSFV